MTAIDKASRKVTLMRSDGTTQSVQVGSEAVNFAQLEVGDTVGATLTGELVAFVAAAGDDVSDATTTEVKRAQKGAQPGGEAVATVRRVGTVVALDRLGRQVTLRFADGSVETFPARPDENLEAHKVGDRVVFEATERIAVSVTKH